MAIGEQSSMRVVLIAIAIIGLFGIITFALAAATLGTLNKRVDDLNQNIETIKEIIRSQSSPTTTTIASTTTATTTPNTITSTTSNADLTSDSTVISTTG